MLAAINHEVRQNLHSFVQYSRTVLSQQEFDLTSIILKLIMTIMTTICPMSMAGNEAFFRVRRILAQQAYSAVVVVSTASGK